MDGVSGPEITVTAAIAARGLREGTTTRSARRPSERPRRSDCGGLLVWGQWQGRHAAAQDHQQVKVCMAAGDTKAACEEQVNVDRALGEQKVDQ